MLKKYAVKWAKALRSGKYQQSRMALRNSKGYCCLGVACEITGRPLNRKIGGCFTIKGSNKTDFLPKVVQRALKMHSSNGAQKDGNSLKIGQSLFKTLSRANDFGMSFSDIADYIEKNYKQL